jgi:hypothetical protein
MPAIWDSFETSFSLYLTKDCLIKNFPISIVVGFPFLVQFKSRPLYLIIIMVTLLSVQSEAYQTSNITKGFPVQL